MLRWSNNGRCWRGRNQPHLIPKRLGQPGNGRVGTTARRPARLEVQPDVEARRCQSRGRCDANASGRSGSRTQRHPATTGSLTPPANSLRNRRRADCDLESVRQTAVIVPSRAKRRGLRRFLLAPTSGRVLGGHVALRFGKASSRSNCYRKIRSPRYDARFAAAGFPSARVAAVALEMRARPLQGGWPLSL